ncbi:hypothetical protein GX586_10040 [bacterium]|nr:hypothetical protein [bacterium]
MKRRRRQKASLRIRALDPDAWKVFSRKAGAMKHKSAKRAAQKRRNELDQSVSDALGRTGVRP